MTSIFYGFCEKHSQLYIGKCFICDKLIQREIFNFQESILLPPNSILKCVDDELEFPGEMPEELFDFILNVAHDKDKMTEFMRSMVRLVKSGIRERLENLIKENENG